jgi:hypothetical protein
MPPDDEPGANADRKRPHGPTFLIERFPRAGKYAPAVFFIGGFLWDALTLGRSIKPIDLWILGLYLIGAIVILLLLGRGTEFRGSQYVGFALEFLFGGIFSALFSFYFLSSGGLGGYLFVLALAALLVGNEFLGNRYSELTLSWTMFTLCALMFFNFALAHVFRSINTFWFYLGTIIAVLLVAILRSLARRESASIVPSIGVASLLVILHVFNLIPPVPLVKKQMVIAHDVHREGNAYLARVERPGWRIWRMSSPIFHRRDGEPVYCFTSVFIPNGIKTTIRHRWEHLDDSTGDWTTMDVRPFPIEGGRQGGYRGYTLKQNLIPGRWRVTAESEVGETIGFVDFTVANGKAGRMKTVRL